jgi:hypothetical protein
METPKMMTESTDQTTPVHAAIISGMVAPRLVF